MRSGAWGGEELAQIEQGAARDEWRRHWPLVLAGASGMSLASVSTTSFGVMMLPLEHELGWSRAQISLGPLVLTVTVIVVGTVMGYAADRLGARIVALFSAVLIIGAIVTMSQLTANPLLWLLIWMVLGLGSTAIPTVTVLPVTKGFFAGRGLAVALVLCGSGFSTLVVPIVANYLVESQGWRNAYLGLAGIWGMVVFPIFLLFLREPPIVPIPATGEADAARDLPSIAPGFTPSQGFRSPSFYKLFSASVLTVTANQGLLLNLVPVLRSNGMAAGTAAWIYGFSGIATIAGRVMCGWLLDRFNASKVVGCAVIALTMTPLMLLAVPGSVALALVAVIAAGLLGGMTSPANAYLTGKHFGARNFGTFYSTINVASAIGLGVGPLIANLVYDRTKNYELVMWCAVPMLVCAGLLYMSLGKYPKFEAA